MSVHVAADLNSTLNLVVVVGVVVVVLRRLRPVLSPGWWRFTAFAMLTFGPMMTVVWWNQFDNMVLAAAIAGFDLLRRGRPRAGAAAIGISVAFKPLAILLPLVLLARRETRRAGAIAIGWVIGLNVLGQVFMAWRAHALGPLDPIKVLHDFANASAPSAGRACNPENFAPSSTLCQLAGEHDLLVQHLVVWAGCALLGVWIVEALRGRRGLSWEVFAFTCPMSVMVSPVAWSHYQVMLAPLFLLLLVRFTRQGATLGNWLGLAAAFVLASVVWRPYGTMQGAVIQVLTGAKGSEDAWVVTEEIAQFAQYVLIVTGVIWYTQAATRDALRRLAALGVGSDETDRGAHRWDEPHVPRQRAAVAGELQ
jgi:Glycosyltransferase family 87